MTTGFQADAFLGDFDALPLRSHILFGAVPRYPIEDDFHHAVSVAFHANDAAAEWRIEAVRWRRSHSDGELDLHAIATATAERLYQLCRGIEDKPVRCIT